MIIKGKLLTFDKSLIIFSTSDYIKKKHFVKIA